jgi:hypothetical protein
VKASDKVFSCFTNRFNSSDLTCWGPEKESAAVVIIKASFLSDAPHMFEELYRHAADESSLSPVRFVPEA